MKKFFVCSAAVFGVLACLYIGCNQVQGSPLPAGDMPAARNASTMSSFTFSVTEDAYFREGFAGGGTIAGTFDAVEMADISSLKLTGNAAYPDNAYFYIGNGQLVVKTNKNSGRYKDGSLVSGDYAIEVSGYDGKRETLPQRFKLSVGAPIEIASFSAFTLESPADFNQAQATVGAIAGEFNVQGSNPPFSFTLTGGAGGSDNQYFTVDGSKLRVSGNGEKFLSDLLKAGTYRIRATVTDATNDVLAKDFLLTIEEPRAGLYHLDADGNKIWEVAGSPAVERSFEWLSLWGVPNSNYTIVLDTSEFVSPLYISNPYQNTYRTYNLTLKGEGVISLQGSGSLFTVPAGFTLILDSQNLKLKGFAGNDSPLIRIASSRFISTHPSDGGTLILKAGAIEGNGGGGVWVDGLFIMEGGTISGNSFDSNNLSDSFGGVRVERDGTFTMSGGSIVGNKAQTGGGVYARYGKFDMSGGTISGNTAIGDGGGVRITSGEFRMSGGTISKNSSPNGWGGGVCVGSANGIDPGFFELSGSAIISGNAAQHGGGVYMGIFGTLHMKAACISSNKAEAGGGVYVQDGTFRQSGGIIISNSASRGSGAYVMNGMPEPEYPSIFILTDDARIGGGIYLEKDEVIRTEGTWRRALDDVIGLARIEPQFYELPNGEPVRVLDESALPFYKFFGVRETYTKEGETEKWFVNRNGVLERGIRD